MEPIMEKPDSVEIDSDGKMFVWDPDGTDEIEENFQKKIEPDLKVENFLN